MALETFQKKRAFECELKKRCQSTRHANWLDDFELRQDQKHQKHLQNLEVSNQLESISKHLAKLEQQKREHLFFPSQPLEQKSETDDCFRTAAFLFVAVLLVAIQWTMNLL